MREIKFRAWLTSREEFVYDAYFDNLEVAVMDETGSWCVVGDREPGGVLQHAILEQFTGLLDANGVEIYKGDVIKNTRYPGIPLAIIRWGIEDETYAGWCIEWQDPENSPRRIRYDLMYYKNLENCEVIGNIHENTELLEA